MSGTPQYVSIHAPVKGATGNGTIFQTLDWSFNPRTREGCDKAYMDVYRGDVGFNPRTREGCDK